MAAPIRFNERFRVGHRCKAELGFGLSVSGQRANVIAATDPIHADVVTDARERLLGFPNLDH